MGDEGRFSDLERVLADRDAGPLDVLREVAKYRRYLLAVEDHAVRSARAAGSTWEQIAQAVGNSRQAAWKRWRIHGIPLGASLLERPDPR
jgi:hypothetical protein